MQKHLKMFCSKRIPSAAAKKVPLIFFHEKKQTQTFLSTHSVMGNIIPKVWLFGLLLSLGRKVNNNHLYHKQNVASSNS